MTTRLVSFAQITIALTCHGDLPAQIIDFLYRHLPAAPPAPPPILTYHLRCDDEPGLLTLHRNNTLLYRGHSPAAAAELLLGDSGQVLAAFSRGGLLFHAAGLARQGCGLLLPGPTGCGKSTLTAWLLGQGFDYLSDELVFIPAGSSLMQGFSRPLNLKPPAMSVLSLRLNPADPVSHSLRTRQADTSQATLFRPDNTLTQVALERIVFPHYQPGGEFSLRPLSKARAGLELLRCLLNARNLPEHGLPEVSRLVRQTPASQLRYNNFAQLGQWLKSCGF